MGGLWVEGMLGGCDAAWPSVVGIVTSLALLLARRWEPGSAVVFRWCSVSRWCSRAFLSDSKNGMLRSVSASFNLRTVHPELFRVRRSEGRRRGDRSRLAFERLEECRRGGAMSLGRRRRDLRAGLLDCEGPMTSGLPGDRCPEP